MPDEPLDESFDDQPLDDEPFAEAGELSIGPPVESSVESPVETWPVRRFARSSAGSSLAAAMMGLGQVLEPSKKEIPAIVVEYDANGEPFTEPIVLRLDPDNPSDSIVLIRKHLLRKPASGAD